MVIVEVNSSGEFIYTQFIRGKMKQRKIREFTWKTHSGKKSRCEERKIPQNQRDYKEHSVKDSILKDSISYWGGRN